MTSLHHRKWRHCQQGIAAVEFALVLPLLILLLIVPLYFGRVMWHYAAMQKAAQNGARFLASVPLATMRDPNKVGYALQLTDDIVRAHLDELNPGEFPLVIDKDCNDLTCTGYSTPTTVTVGVQMNVQDIFFPESTQMTIGLTAEATVSYLGK
ncbi:MAG: pilus assembly protein [Burkholderiaceae bacterium]|nr:pilus assembly protein [Burkholderiaceae bacterium]